MSRPGAQRAIDIAALLLGTALPAALLGAVRMLPRADVAAAGLGWIAPAVAAILALAASFLAVGRVVPALRGHAPTGILSGAGAAALAGGGLALSLTSHVGGLVTALPFAAVLLLAAHLAEGALPDIIGRRTRVAAVGAGLLLAEGAVLGGVLPATAPTATALQTPLLLGAAAVAATAALVTPHRWSAASAMAIAVGATGILVDRGGGLELVIGLVALVAAVLAGFRALPRRRGSHAVTHPESGLPSLAHQLDDAILHFDGNLGLRDWNAAGAALFGLDQQSSGMRLEDLLGVTIAELPALDGRAVASTAVGGLAVRLHRSDEGVVAVVAATRDRVDDDRLGRELRGTIEELLQARRTIELQRNEIERSSAVDLLTGVASRGAILDRLRIEIAQARRYQHPVAVVLLDIDDFAAVNHRHGVGGGDTLLREVALRMRLRVREADALGRAGSDGFLAVLPHTDEAGAATFADALRHRLAQRPVPVGDELVALTVSIGVAVMRPGEDLDPDGVLARVGEALESARRAGGDRIALDRDHGFIRLGPDRATAEPSDEQEAT